MLFNQLWEIPNCFVGADFFRKKTLKRWGCVGYPLWVSAVGIQVVKGKPLYVGLAEKREVRAERLRTWVLLLEDGKGGKKRPKTAKGVILRGAKELRMIYFPTEKGS